MGRRKSDGTIEVHDGVYLKQTSESAPWQCYFRQNDTQFRRSTKTKDLAVAKQTAMRWYNDARERVHAGGAVERVSFSVLSSRYLDWIAGLGKYSYHKDTLSRHLNPFFEKFSDVSKLRQSDIDAYTAHRQTKGSSKPQTINRENTVLRQILKFGERQGAIVHAIHVDHLNEKLTRHRRRHFTIEEYMKLCHRAKERIAELEGIPLQTSAYQSRLLLYDYIKVLVNSGMRVDEAKTLRWRNVDLDNKTVLIERAGKTKKVRTAFVRETGREALDRIMQRRITFLARQGKSLDKGERVFSTPDGRAVDSFKKGFDALLVAAGFVYEDVSQKHSATSLRHSYATFRLTTKRTKRATMRALAKQMGTSERMIERHYGHDQIYDYEDELVGQDQGTLN